MTHIEELLGTSVVRVASAPGRAKMIDLPLTPDRVPMGVRDEVAQHYGFSECNSNRWQPRSTTSSVRR